MEKTPQWANLDPELREGIEVLSLEFLVKKKQPLVLPPDFDKLPAPDSKENKEINENDKIKEILKAPKELNNVSGKSSLEESVLNKIRK